MIIAIQGLSTPGSEVLVRTCTTVHRPPNSRLAPCVPAIAFRLIDEPPRLPAVLRSPLVTNAVAV